MIIGAMILGSEQHIRRLVFEVVETLTKTRNRPEQTNDTDRKLRTESNGSLEQTTAVISRNTQREQYNQPTSRRTTKR